MKELVIALGAAVFGLVGTVVGAVLASRSAKAGADKNAETVQRQVQDQAAAEQAHWLRQQRLSAYEGFLEAWDECLRITRASHHPSSSEADDLEPLREASARVEERARRIALLGPQEVTQAAESLARTMRQNVDVADRFIQAAAGGISGLDQGSDAYLAAQTAVQSALEDYQEHVRQLQALMADARERGEDLNTLDGHPLLAEVLASGNRLRELRREALDAIQGDFDVLAGLTAHAQGMVGLFQRNEAASEVSREQFTTAVRRALDPTPSTRSSPASPR
ncbi:hypothetical protein [Streptomyces sp. NPDC006879]|uniref:hypothetical protein n=1 Tax=Streptomyces sp. NPDC006879 TaxID=3364767 RepID=UPI0036883C5C